MPQQRADGADLERWPERGVEQAHGVQELQPLAVLHVALAAGHVAHVLGVDQADLESTGLQQFEQRDPVHPGRLHRHRANAALL